MHTALLKKFAASAILSGMVGSALAANYPSQPIRMIVPFGAGGITDIIARQLGKAMSDELGQSIVIENRAGAGGTIGAQAAVSSAPDGYTVFMGTVGTQIVNPLIMPKINYDPVNLVPVGMVSGSPYVLAINGNLKPKTFDEFVAYAKSNPGKLNFGSAGIGSSPHLGGELLKLTTGIDIVHIPFKSGGEAVSAVVGGQVDIVLDAIPVVMPHAESGKLTALGLAAAKRSPAANIPTTVELGAERLQISSWNALFVPKGTPDNAIKALNAALQKALASKAFSERLEAQGTQTYTGTLEEYEAFISAERAKWEEIVKTANIKLD